MNKLEHLSLPAYSAPESRNGPEVDEAEKEDAMLNNKTLKKICCGSALLEALLGLFIYASGATIAGGMFVIIFPDGMGFPPHLINSDLGDKKWLINFCVGYGVGAILMLSQSDKI